ncbi:MAG: ADP-glyceromanno-heptose 6-epimerase [Caldithrix sp.]|nr:ADP-glyceromanno-heptose 6-epimerase [Caldithrix sp.]
MIIVTGASGFIGSCIISKLNQEGITDILAVDVLRENDKWKNLRHLQFYDYIDRSQLMAYMESSAGIKAIIHMGACSATTEKDAHYLMENNYRYTLSLARYAIYTGMRFIYASSAATYGKGEQGYDDDENQLHTLTPMNMYGYSKQLFDLKAYRENWMGSIAGLKFFNVYGPNEYFKGDMASVVFKAYNQIKSSGSVRLFKSHLPEYNDGEQLRDFLYIKDVVEVVYFLLQHPAVNGLYNVGSGKARTFKDLVNATFDAMGKESNIKYIDMPPEIRDRYQYFTQASMDKMRAAGYDKPFYSLEEGITDYVRNYLMKNYRHY